ncbi:MAG: metabolite traffic protein EboE [Candidatus Nanopelagicaceae bacterium]|nr:metabolite traffic protein EboE [Candidatus Nanopelagicaceae bacterium]
MDLGNGYGHLTYSTLVHPGDTWSEMKNSLQTYVPEVKRRFCPSAPMGVSLRLSNASVEELIAKPEERIWLKDFLDENHLYVFTVNAFPFGPFKCETIKEKVYEPDWTTESRTNYTMRIADILAEVTGPEVEPTIQTAPLAFRPKVTSESYIAQFNENIYRVIAHLMSLEKSSGRRVKLAVEPEPFCFLETIPETVDWFKTKIYSLEAAERISKYSGQPLAEVFGATRRYLGVVLDICHQSVEFENIADDIDQLSQAGIPIFKLQEAAALRVDNVTAEIVEELKKYTGTIYLSQTTQLRNGIVTRFLNLEDAITAWEKDPGHCEWRTHFHVPVFLKDLGPFQTTRSGIDDALAVHARTPLSTHLEIETYTWDVLPEHLKTGDIIEYVVRELEYVRDELARQIAKIQ